MIVEETGLQDCYLLKPMVFQDDRGSFIETYNDRNFTKITGLNPNFVQDNQSISSFGTLRGLHFQKGDSAQAKLVRVIAGEVLDVAVDLRPSSPTFKKYYSVILNGENNYQLFVPRGFAHGFSVLQDSTIFAYKCDNFYDKVNEGGIHYNDLSLNIDWKLKDDQVIVSKKDASLPSLEQYLKNLY